MERQLHSFFGALVIVNSHNRYGKSNILYTYKKGLDSKVGHLLLCSGAVGLCGWDQIVHMGGQ